MRLQYQTVHFTDDGLAEAAQLQATGWIVGSVGMYTIQFYREKPIEAEPPYQDRPERGTGRWFELRSYGHSPAAIVAMTDLRGSYTPRRIVKLDGIFPAIKAPEDA